MEHRLHPSLRRCLRPLLREPHRHLPTRTAPKQAHLRRPKTPSALLRRTETPTAHRPRELPSEAWIPSVHPLSSNRHRIREWEHWSCRTSRAILTPNRCPRNSISSRCTLRSSKLLLRRRPILSWSSKALRRHRYRLPRAMRWFRPREHRRRSNRRMAICGVISDSTHPHRPQRPRKKRRKKAATFPPAESTTMHVFSLPRWVSCSSSR
mmetsp:Transcript_8008/g.19958  ORF Transcript_8008/g.19958 Transcript_8008/m.19958 type:complete len:209 (+) Transcript_8008:506-1132(+)